MTSLEKHLKEIFPESNPNAIFCELMATYELQISTWLGYEQHSQQEIAGMSDLSIEVFKDVFTSSKEDVYLLVNHWNMIRDVYMLNQFEAFKQGDFISKVFIDETQGEEKEQIYFETTISNINYENILTKFVHRDYDNRNGINSRIFFIHPQKQMYLLYFDSEIIIGSNSFSDIKPLYHKYYQHIGIGRRKQFNEYSL